MTVIKTNRFILRPFQKGDEQSLVKNINNKKIYEATLRIPYPYKLKDANKFISKCLKETLKNKPKSLTFAIEINQQVCGGISFDHIEKHQAELGYWLGENYWGKGVITEAAKLLTEFGFKKLGLARIYAYVYPSNKASMRVLQKNGFTREGFLRKNVIKKGRLLDSYLFAKVVG